MELSFNNKSLMECDLLDLKAMIQDLEYRENQYIEYKESFSFIGINKNLPTYREALQKASVEFRNDICSFANAEGGYIIYGIKDDLESSDALMGVEMNNPDKFELEIRNKLTPIIPKVPVVRFRFVKTESDRYIVILRIEHDYYAPYVQIEDQKNYKIFTRDGNQKRIVGYTELKNMFMQSRVLEDEILNFRRKRIEYYRAQGDEKYRRFMIFHMIPESFLSERKQLYIIEKRKSLSFGSVFMGTRVEPKSVPCVDGLRFQEYKGTNSAILYNNGIAEFVLPLTNCLTRVSEDLYFAHEKVWNFIDLVTAGYQSIMPKLFGRQRYFGCISIVGCKDVISEKYDLLGFNTLIDRDELICQPIVFRNLDVEESFCADLKMMHLEYYLSLGIRRKQGVTDLIKEVAIE